MVYLRNFDANEWVRLVRDEGVTTATVVPTMLDRIVSVLERESVELPTLRNLAYGGSKVALPLVRKALDLLPDVGFVNAYGLTETSSTIAVLSPDDHRAALGSTDVADARGASARWGSRCPASRCRSAATTGQSAKRDRRASCSCAESRCRAGTQRSVRCSTTMAGSPPKTLPCLTTTDTCSSAEGPTTPSSAAGRTSPPPRSRTCSSNTRRCATAPWWDPRIPNGARSSSRSSCPPKAPTPDPDELREHVRAQLRGSRTPDRVVFRDELPTNATGKVLRRELVNELSRSRT